MTSRDWQKRVEKLIGEICAAVPARIVHTDENVRHRALTCVALAAKLQEAQDILWAMHEYDQEIDVAR
jgi:hypothetical protein